MMFQKNEAESRSDAYFHHRGALVFLIYFFPLCRCQLAELSLDHFQRLCASSLSLLRANASTAKAAVDDSADIAPARTPTHVMHSANIARPPTVSLNYVPEAGELLAGAASRWAVEDVHAACAADHSEGEISLITLLDEIHRLRVQLSMQHVRVINCYAEGIKPFKDNVNNQ
jgi:hypothetical protein